MVPILSYIGSSLGSSTIYASARSTLTYNGASVCPCPGLFRSSALVKLLRSNTIPTLIGQCPCKLSLGGPALRRWLHHQRRAWTPLPSLLSRLVINRQWQIMNIYSKVFTLSCLHGSEVVQKLHPWSAISQKETRAGVGVTGERPKLSARQLGGFVSSEMTQESQMASL